MIKINVQKKLHMAGGDTVLRVNTELQPNTFTALYGPSGAGKTTLLKILAGLIQPEHGHIEVNRQTWLDTERRINLPAQKRSIGFVFQDFALFPNMTLEENLRYALPDRKDERLLLQLLEAVSMQNFALRKPDTLSGGQKQRVALIRALVRKPQLLLLDEPLSALDHEMRTNLQEVLQQLHREYGLTTIMVSHHLPEIYSLANHVLQIQHGKIVKSGTVGEVFGWEQSVNSITLLGEILDIEPQGIKVLVNNQVIIMAAAGNWQIGDKVTIACQAADLTLKKLL